MKKSIDFCALLCYHSKVLNFHEVTDKMNILENEGYKLLVKAILSLETEEECNALLDDLMTKKELLDTITESGNLNEETTAALREAILACKAKFLS